MKKNIERECYEFIGDSTQNIARRTTKGQPTQDFTQTKVIKALNEKKEYVIKGTKIESSIDSTRQAYIIEYGLDKEHVDQIIKIVVDKEQLLAGDPNALAIDSLCKHSIKVKTTKNVKKILTRTVLAAAAIGTAVAMTWAAAEAFEGEAKYQDLKTEQHVHEMQQQQMLNGQVPIGDGSIYLDFSQESGRSL